MHTPDYDAVQDIDNEPYFNLGVCHVLKKRYQIILLVEDLYSKCMKLAHRFGYIYQSECGG